MNFFNNSCKTLCIAVFSGLIISPAYSIDVDKDNVATSCAYQQSAFLPNFNSHCSHMIFQVGGFDSYSGRAQNIYIDGLIGDYFTVSDHHQQNFLLGAGYFIDGINQNNFNFMAGIDAFYLANTKVQGIIFQENLFANLDYQYKITNYPIYLAAKTSLNSGIIGDNIMIDLGIGPNIIQISGFNEGSLNGGITIPDRAFSGNTSVAFSATAGIGVQFNHLLGYIPLEIGYRFFYLGQGNLNKINTQIINDLNTGSNYANAIVASVVL